MLSKFRRYGLAMSLSIGTLGLGTVWVLAQGPSRNSEVINIEGKVTELTRNDHNDPDGWKLADGQFVHVPPHAFADLNAHVKAGASVKATTVKKQRPDGTTVNEAVVVEVGEQRIAILPPVPRTPHLDEKPMKAKGKIVSFHENKHGDVDGLLLTDDTTIKFPPHMGESLGKELKIGTEVSVNGRRHETPKGDVHLHADDITAGGYVYTIDAARPPKHGPGHSPRNEDWMTKKQADEMLSELRVIRKLMEEKAK